MKRHPPLRSGAPAAALLAIVVAFAGLLVAAAGTPAAAQGYGWFGNLFGGGAPNRPQSSRPNFPGFGGGEGDGYGTSQGDASVPRRRLRRHPVAQAQRPGASRDAAATPPPPKKNATAFVYVFGDTLGQALANGLDDALVDRPDVAVVHKARGPSGLVTKDYYDWQKAIDTQLASKDKIDVAVMMIGSNDRQPIRKDGATLDVDSDAWKTVYTQRVMAIDEAFRAKGIPLIWVGVPITKDGDFADTMAALNDIYRDAAGKTGATYVDTWEAFSDDNGDFSAFGPDVDGQTARLRSSDGVLFTRAGARKLAHFVEAHVRRDLDGRAPPPVLPTAGTPDASTGSGAKTPNGKGVAAVAAKPVIVKPVAGPIVNLNQVPAAQDGALLPAPASPGPGSLDAAAAYARGEPEAAPPGRADDASWPAAGPKSP